MRDSELAGITSEVAATLRRQWFDSVYEIADIEYQRRTWLTPPDRSPHWTYVEFCCSYPDADDLQAARDNGYLSAEVFELLAALDEALVSYTAADAYDHRAILEDPNWHAVVAKAEQIRQQLLTLTVDPVEQRHLMGQLGIPRWASNEPHSE
jgi:hypothetical protein